MASAWVRMSTGTPTGRYRHHVNVLASGPSCFGASATIRATFGATAAKRTRDVTAATVIEWLPEVCGVQRSGHSLGMHTHAQIAAKTLEVTFVLASVLVMLILLPQCHATS